MDKKNEIDESESDDTDDEEVHISTNILSFMRNDSSTIYNILLLKSDNGKDWESTMAMVWKLQTYGLRCRYVKS